MEENGVVENSFLVIMLSKVIAQEIALWILISFLLLCIIIWLVDMLICSPIFFFFTKATTSAAPPASGSVQVCLEDHFEFIICCETGSVVE